MFCARSTALILSAGLLFAVLGCGPDEVTPIAPGTPTSAVLPSSPITVTEVLFAHGLNPQWQPIGGAQSTFPADQETVWTRVTIAGRPRTGVITQRWMWRDMQIGEFSLDLSEVDDGAFLGFGSNTYLQGYVTPRGFYIGSGHRLVLLAGETELGSYGFTIVPPEGARPSRFISAGLHLSDPRFGDPGPERETFLPHEHVHVVGRASLGKRSWLECTATTNGQVIPGISREMVSPDGGELTFTMDMFPEGGWPIGQHRILLLLDENEVAAYEITIEAP